MIYNSKWRKLGVFICYIVFICIFFFSPTNGNAQIIEGQLDLKDKRQEHELIFWNQSKKIGKITKIENDTIFFKKSKIVKKYATKNVPKIIARRKYFKPKFSFGGLANIGIHNMNHFYFPNSFNAPFVQDIGFEVGVFSMVTFNKFISLEIGSNYNSFHINYESEGESYHTIPELYSFHYDMRVNSLEFPFKLNLFLNRDKSFFHIYGGGILGTSINSNGSASFDAINIAKFKTANDFELEYRQVGFTLGICLPVFKLKKDSVQILLDLGLKQSKRGFFGPPPTFRTMNVGIKGVIL